MFKASTHLILKREGGNEIVLLANPYKEQGVGGKACFLYLCIAPTESAIATAIMKIHTLIGDNAYLLTCLLILCGTKHPEAMTMVMSSYELWKSRYL